MYPKDLNNSSSSSYFVKTRVNERKGKGKGKGKDKRETYKSGTEHNEKKQEDRIIKF